ncbi:unnamed protein product, partial [marine sediment metagenome]
MRRDTLTHWILQNYPLQTYPSEEEVSITAVENKLLKDLMYLKAAVSTAKTAISRMVTIQTEKDARWAQQEIENIQEDVYDMYKQAMILKEHPERSFLEEDTVEKIRRETRKLLGETLPGLGAEIATVKKDAKTYQSIAKSLKEMLQGISNIDLYLIRYSGGDTKGEFRP